MKNQENWVIIGRFGKPHGIKGFVTIQSFTEPQDNVLKYASWHVFIEYKWQPIKLLDIRIQNQSLIAQIEGYPDRESVARLTHIKIAIQQDQLEKLKPGEYYWHQLIGMNVVSLKGEFFGKIVEIIPTGANDVLVVEGNKKHLIPYVPDQFVLDIDTDQQLITVDWDMDF